MRMVIAAPGMAASGMAAIALAALLAGCTETGRPAAAEANRWAVSAANNVGPPVDCIDTALIRGRLALDDRTIDFRLADGSTVRNRLPYSCPGLLRTSRFSYRTALGRLCSVDLITLIEPDGRAGGSCGLGLFQPVAIPPRPAPLAGR